MRPRIDTANKCMIEYGEPQAERGERKRRARR